MGESHNSSVAPPLPYTPPSLLVLHVNDSTDDQVLLQAAAKSAGVPIEWHVADSVKRGVSYLKSLVDLSHKHTVRWVDLVLLDLLFHDGTGFDIIHFIRSTPEISGLSIAVLTGLTNPVTLEEAQRLGANAVHEKPISFDETVKLVALIYQNWSHVRHMTR